MLAFIGKAGTYTALLMQQMIKQLLESISSVSDDELKLLPVATPYDVNKSEIRMGRKAFHRSRVDGDKGPAKK
jgi:hypothetical protein